MVFSIVRGVPLHACVFLVYHSQMAWVIVGLGNPNSEYKGTRHNFGRDAVVFYGSKIGCTEWVSHSKANADVAKGPSATLVLPNTYMNKSGNAVAVFVKSVKASEHLVVVHDDLDMPFGSMKVSFNRGSGGHKGVESVMRAVKTKKFVRVRLGISPTTASGALRKPQGDEAVQKFILSKCTPKEKEQVSALFKRVSFALDCVVKEGREKAMNKFN